MEQSQTFGLAAPLLHQMSIRTNDDQGLKTELLGQLDRRRKCRDRLTGTGRHLQDALALRAHPVSNPFDLMWEQLQIGRHARPARGFLAGRAPDQLLRVKLRRRLRLVFLKQLLGYIGEVQDLETGIRR